MNPAIQQQIAAQIQQQGNPQVAMQGTLGAQPSLSPAPTAPLPDRSIHLHARPGAAHRALQRRGVQVSPQMEAQLAQIEAMQAQQQPPVAGQSATPVPTPQSPVPAQPAGPQGPSPMPTPQMPQAPSGPPPSNLNTPITEAKKKVSEPEKAAHQQKFMEVLQQMIGKIV